MSTYGYDALYSLWTTCGGNRANADMAAAIALAESGGDTTNVSPTNDYGLWQINIDAHPEYRDDPSSLFDPTTNCRAAIAISSNGSNWRPWCTAYADGACGTKGGAYLGAGAPFYRFLHGAAPSGSSGGATGGSDRPTLQLGSTGVWVMHLQNFLITQGLYHGAVDSDFGPATQAAVVAFQRAHGLTPDGVVGPQTWAAIDAISAPSNVDLHQQGNVDIGTSSGDLQGPGSSLTFGSPGSLPGTGAPYEPFPTTVDRAPALVTSPGTFGVGSVAVAGGLPTSLDTVTGGTRAPAEPVGANAPVFGSPIADIQNAVVMQAASQDPKFVSVLQALDNLGP